MTEQSYSKKIYLKIYDIFNPYNIGGNNITVRYHKKDKTCMRPLTRQLMPFTYSKQFSELNIGLFSFNEKEDCIYINNKPYTTKDCLAKINKSIKMFKWEITYDNKYCWFLVDNSELNLDYNIEEIERIGLKHYGLHH